MISIEFGASLRGCVLGLVNPACNTMKFKVAKVALGGVMNRSTIDRLWCVDGSIGTIIPSAGAQSSLLHNHDRECFKIAALGMK